MPSWIIDLILCLNSVEFYISLHHFFHALACCPIMTSFYIWVNRPTSTSRDSDMKVVYKIQDNFEPLPSLRPAFSYPFVLFELA